MEWQQIVSNAVVGFGASSFRNGILSYKTSGGDGNTFAHETGHGLGLDHPAPSRLRKTNRDKWEYIMRGNKPFPNGNGKNIYRRVEKNGGLMSYRPNRQLSNREVVNMISPAINYPNTLKRRKRKRLGNVYSFRLKEN